MAVSLKKDNSAYSFPNDISSGDFNPDFVWGAGSSSYQVEGAVFEGGRQPSIWDAFCLKNPGSITNGDNGNKAVNAYYKTKEDVQMMKRMGLKAYRFSISWSRILPGGKLSMGVNQEGINHYNALINELISNGIEPYVTLFHWETPNALEEDYMGFLSKKIVSDFVNYAELCFWEFGDRVKHWVTVNEPWTYAAGGYAYGTLAPGRGGSQIEISLASGFNLGSRYRSTGRARSFDNESAGDPATEPYIVGHNMLIAHAAVAKLYRQRFQVTQGGQIGITLSNEFYEPLDATKQDDIDAANRGQDFVFGWFMQPLVSGEYPQTMIDNVKERLPTFTEEQKNLLMTSYDFLGLNYYTSQYATIVPPTGILIPDSYVTDSRGHTQPEDLNGGGAVWFYSYAPGLYKSLLRVKDNYGNPVVYIHENGWPDSNNNDIKIEEARVDSERIDYLNHHIHSVHDAISEGSDVKGYFTWSLMDSFEWNSGYSVRFGLFYIDYAHGKYTRYPKTSAIWYKNFLKNSEKLLKA